MLKSFLKTAKEEISKINLDSVIKDAEEVVTKTTGKVKEINFDKVKEDISKNSKKITKATKKGIKAFNKEIKKD